MNLDEHVAGEQAVPGGLGDDPDVELVVGVGPGVTILNVNLPVLEVRQHPGIQGVELFHRKRFVHLAPPDVFLAGRFLDDEFVVGGPAGVFPGRHAHRSQVSQNAFLPADDMLVQEGTGKIPVNFFEIPDAVVFQTDLVFEDFLRHEKSPFSRPEGMR